MRARIWHFEEVRGSKRSGTIQTLIESGAENGFDVSVITSEQTKLSSGQTVEVSSTIIRDLLAKGNVADAAIAMGRPYRLAEEIISGRGKGKYIMLPYITTR